jgi:hypothetical protein
LTEGRRRGGAAVPHGDAPFYAEAHQARREI